MTPLCLAAAQAESVRGEVSVNVEHHARLARRAGELGAQVVVFPELSLTGYELDLAESLAFSPRDERLDPLRDVAGAKSLTLIVGAPVRLDSGLHIGAFVLGSDGSTEIYTKQHPAGDETSVFAPGPLDPILELGDDRAALAICADTSHPEHAEAAATRGANVYLAGVFFDPAHYPIGVERLAGYAERHAMTVAMANSGGPATGFASPGGSAIWSDDGDLVARLDGAGAGLVVARRSERGWTGEAARVGG